MDWLAEAQALIEDMKPYVEDIKVSSQLQSDNNQIFFDVTLLEKREILVCMNSSGFTICDGKNNAQDPKVYETINALLDDNSEKYRNAFVAALQKKVGSIDS